MAQMGWINEKSRGPKSRGTVPLKAEKICKSIFGNIRNVCDTYQIGEWTLYWILPLQYNQEEDLKL